MTEIENVTLPAFKYICGDSEDICRLCFNCAEDGAALDEPRTIQCAYFDDTVTFIEMFIELGITIENGLPQMLCACCVDSAIKSFLFLKLCQHSNSQWHDAIDQFNKTLDLANTLAPSVQTAYFLPQQDNSIFTSKNKLINKHVAVKKITNLLKAKKTYYDKVKKEYASVCETCGAHFKSRKDLGKHKRKLHSKISHTCPYCSRIFPSLAQVHNHVDRLHKPKVLQCPKCDKTFSTSKLLLLHDANNHRAAICNRCFIQFPSKKDLKQHLDKHDVHKCSQCNKEFNNKYTYKLHTKICGNNEGKQLKFFCDICEKGYCRKNGLRSHLITDHGFGRVFTCKWCNKPFDAPSKLKNHTVKHTRERNFHCTQCGALFVTQAALVYHVRLHTGEKPFPCDMCDEKFLSASRRMEHKRRKHLSPVKVCPICYHAFVTSHELKKHLIRHKNPKSRLFVAENEAISW